MILNMAITLMWGILMGIHLGKISNKEKDNSRDHAIEILEDLLKVYEEHEEDLKDTINYYKNGMNETIRQNIELQRRLNNGNGSRVQDN